MSSSKPPSSAGADSGCSGFGALRERSPPPEPPPSPRPSSICISLATISVVKRSWPSCPCHLQPLLFVDGGWAGLMRASEEHLGQYRQAVEESVGAVTDALGAGRSPTEQLRRFVENFTHVNIAQSDVTREYLRHEAYVPQEAMVAINAAKDEFDRQLAGLLRAGVESGEFEVRDPRLAGLAISGMVSWMYRWYSEQGRLAPDDVAQEMADLVLGMVSGR